MRIDMARRVQQFIHDSYTGDESPLDDDVPDWEMNIGEALMIEFGLSEEEADRQIAQYFAL